MSALAINGVVPGGGDCPMLVREGDGSRPCRARAGAGMLACRSHWRAVPPPIQREVLRAAALYRAGRIDVGEFRDVQRVAVEAVSP